MLTKLVGASAGAVVLQALALELILKVRLARCGKKPWSTHDHAALFAEIPEPERTAANGRYRSRRHPSMRETLQDAMAASAPLFEEWRYMHEHSQVTAPNTEMQCAFEALADGL